MCGGVRAFSEREHDPGRTRSSSESKPFYTVTEDKPLAQKLPHPRGATTPPPPLQPAACNAVTSSGLFHLFSKISVWEQTENERTCLSFAN